MLYLTLCIFLHSNSLTFECRTRISGATFNGVRFRVSNLRVLYCRFLQSISAQSDDVLKGSKDFRPIAPFIQGRMNSLFSGQSEISADLKLSVDGGESSIDAMEVRTKDTLAFTASVTGN